MINLHFWYASSIFMQHTWVYLNRIWIMPESSSLYTKVYILYEQVVLLQNMHDFFMFYVFPVGTKYLIICMFILKTDLKIDFNYDNIFIIKGFVRIPFLCSLCWLYHYLSSSPSGSERSSPLSKDHLPCQWYFVQRLFLSFLRTCWRSQPSILT